MKQRRYVKIATKELADLKARLRAAEMKVEELTGRLPEWDLLPAWREGLTGSESYLVLALAKAHPRWVSTRALEDAIPSFDRNKEREANTLNVLAYRVRKKLGAGVIETKAGFRRLSDEAHAHLFGGDEARQAPPRLLPGVRSDGETSPSTSLVGRDAALTDFPAMGKACGAGAVVE